MTAIPQAGPPPAPPLEAGRLRAACAAAAAALDEVADDAAAIDAAFARLHEATDGQVIVSLFGREHERLWLLAQHGYRLVPDGVPLDRGIIGRAARDGARFVADVARDGDYVAGAECVVSELAIPLGDERPAIAVLNVETSLRLTRSGCRHLTELAARLTPRVAAVRGSGTLDVSALARLFVHSSSLRDVGSIAELAARSLARLLGLDCAQVNLGAAGRRRAAAGSWCSPDGLDPLPADAVDAIVRAAGRDAVFDLLDLAEIDPQLARAHGRRGVALVPLRVNGVEIGVLVGSSRQPIRFDRSQAEVAALLGAHAGASLDAAVALTRERQAALTDPLTGVLNRRGFDDRLDEELDRARREDRSLAVVVFDCDDFKRMNDTGGHELGDRVLCSVGRHLRTAKRSWDTAARVGGDEFVVLLPDATPRQAHAAATRLRRGLGDALARAGYDLSISVGIASYPHDGANRDELLRAADRAMYRAKELGKDRAVAFAELAAGGGPDNVVEIGSRRRRTRGAPTLPTEHASGGGGMMESLDVLTRSAAALAAERSREATLGTACRELTRLLGAGSTIVSRLDGDVLREIASHFVVEQVDLSSYAYALADYPLTRDVLETAEPRAVCLSDEDVDPSEAFVLREVGMQAVLMVPIRSAGRPWGLIEVYDGRPRRFSQGDVGVAMFVASHLGRLLAGFQNDEATERLYWETLASVTNALEAKDTYTSRHTQEVRALARSLAERLGMSEDAVQTVELGALLHDIGKIRVPESILNKPGPLDDEEWAVIRTHPEVGERILEPISPLRDVLPIVRSHHERWDGRGYPDGLAGDAIPLGARIIAVCDAWRAMNEPRPYREPLGHDAALSELWTHAGTQFDAAVVKALVELLTLQDGKEPLLHRPPAAGPA